MSDLTFRTVVVEADPGNRGRMRPLVEATSALALVAEFATVADAAATAAAIRPDLVVVDLPHPNGDGPEPAVAGIERLVRAFPDSAILVENQGRTTRESLGVVADMMHGRDLDRAILVSDPFHMLRLSIVARGLGLTPYTSPTPTSPIGLSFVFSMPAIDIATSARAPIACEPSTT